MKANLGHPALREAERGRPQADSDAGAIARQYFHINIRSIRWYPKADQGQRTPNADIEEKVPALFVPEETRNYIGKAFFETWCNTHGYSRPEIDIVRLDFSLNGQTQRFESVHHIIDNRESVQFYSNRPSAEPYRRSLLEEYMRGFCINSQKRHGSTHPREGVAVRSQTWPPTSRRWPQIPENQCARIEQNDQPIIRLGEPKDYVGPGLPAIDSDEVTENHDESREFLAQHASGGTLPGDVPTIMATPPGAILSSDASSPQNNSAKSECPSSSDDPCMGQVSDNQALINLVPQVTSDAEDCRVPVSNWDDPESDTRIHENVRHTSSCQMGSMMLPETDASSLDCRPQTVESASEHQDENLTSVTALQGWNEPGVAVGTSLDSQDENPAIPGGLLEANRRFHASSLDTDCSEPDLSMGSPDSSGSSTFTSELRCHSVIRDIYQIDQNLAGGSEQQEGVGIGRIREGHDGTMAQDVPSPGKLGCRETGLSKKRLDWMDGVSARKDETPNFAKSNWPAGASSRAIPPARDVGKVNGPEIEYKNTATDNNSKEAMDSENGEQEPDGYHEKDKWDLCQESDQDSIHSSDGEGLPFTDDYWTYDEEAGNYYHIDVGDDGTETISWYPTEFD